MWVTWACHVEGPYERPGYGMSLVGVAGVWERRFEMPLHARRVLLAACSFSEERCVAERQWRIPGTGKGLVSSECTVSKITRD